MEEPVSNIGSTSDTGLPFTGDKIEGYKVTSYYDERRCGAVGCSSENTNEKLEVNKKENQLQKKEELVFVNYRDIRDLNPHLYAGEMYAQEMLYETLVNIGPNGYEPCLAESWNISEDGKTYTFNIRKGVTFSDGTICDAHAIKANFDAILENKSDRRL